MNQTSIDFDVAIIGGGIAGADSAQHLTAAGYKVLLLERNDFGSGSTGRSSRILHWGIRFLAPQKSSWEHVFEVKKFIGSLRSARVIYRDFNRYADTIGEYLNPIRLILPFRRDLKIYGWQIDLGSIFLGGLAARVRVAFRRFSGRRLQSEGPRFSHPEQIRHIVEFTDYQFMWADRICIDAMLDAERLGADVRNYAEVDRITLDRDGKDRWTIRARSVETNQVVEHRAKFIVNTGGAWVDDILSITYGSSNTSPGPKVTPTKGTHLMAKLPTNYRGRGIVDRNELGNPLFILPWGEYHYIGPTERLYEDDKECVCPTEGEIEFILASFTFAFGRLLTREDVVFAWSGLRPRTYRKGFPGGDGTVSGVLHDLSKEGIPNYLAVTWCTINQHRATAAAVVDFVSARVPASGGKQTVSYEPRTTLGKQVVIEGQRALDMDCIRVAIESEKAKTLGDVFFRRTPYGWGPYLTMEQVERVSQEMKIVLGWS